MLQAEFSSVPAFDVMRTVVDGKEGKYVTSISRLPNAEPNRRYIWTPEKDYCARLVAGRIAKSSPSLEFEWGENEAMYGVLNLDGGVVVEYVDGEYSIGSSERLALPRDSMGMTVGYGRWWRPLHVPGVEVAVVDEIDDLVAAQDTLVIPADAAMLGYAIEQLD